MSTRLTFHGGAKNVTGANYLLEELDGKGNAATRILIDCGLRQGVFFCESSNLNPFPYDPKSIDALIVTHAHIDHTGRVPKLVKAGFAGAIYSTPPTKDFTEHLLIDSENILRQEAQKGACDPIYDINDINSALGQWKKISYRTPVEVKDFTFEFYDAGHILGSSFIVITTKNGQRIVFSGDLGNTPSPLLKETEAIANADYAIMESTYGNRIHENAKERRDILQHIIKDTANKKGILLIPAFALERTQQLLHEINDLAEAKKIPHISVFMDSPLAIKITGVYEKYSEDPLYMNKEALAHLHNGDKIFNFPGLKLTLTNEESKEINTTPAPKIIIAGAGMSHGGRILYHESRYLSDPNTTLLIVGYQTKGSLGRRLLDGAKKVEIFGEIVQVKCRVRALGGYPAHADQPRLLNWLKPMQKQLKKVFIVQGEEDQMAPLSQKIKKDLKISPYIPSPGESIELD
ncbi:MAG: MBL fold metallo-hydrolase [Candidatus Wildermuthbacteria bacterium]|nr:MBL fold metallo-hydrolase [Candidatus Wildermuthbacteria bacterium]